MFTDDRKHVERESTYSVSQLPRVSLCSHACVVLKSNAELDMEPGFTSQSTIITKHPLNITDLEVYIWEKTFENGRKGEKGLWGEM